MSSFRIVNHFINIQNNGLRVTCIHDPEAKITPTHPYYTNPDNKPSQTSLKSAGKPLRNISRMQKCVTRPIQRVHALLIGTPEIKQLLHIPGNMQINPIPAWVNYQEVTSIVVPRRLKGYAARYQTLAELPKRTLIMVDEDGEKQIVLPDDETNTPKKYYGALPSPLHVAKLQIFVAFQDFSGANEKVLWDGKLLPRPPNYVEHHPCDACDITIKRLGVKLRETGTAEEKLVGRRMVCRVAKGRKARDTASEYLRRKKETCRLIREVERVVALSGRNPWEGEEERRVLRPISSVPFTTRYLFKRNMQGKDED